MAEYTIISDHNGSTMRVKTDEATVFRAIPRVREPHPNGVDDHVELPYPLQVEHLVKLCSTDQPTYDEVLPVLCVSIYMQMDDASLMQQCIAVTGRGLKPVRCAIRLGGAVGQIMEGVMDMLISGTDPYATYYKLVAAFNDLLFVHTLVKAWVKPAKPRPVRHIGMNMMTVPMPSEHQHKLLEIANRPILALNIPRNVLKDGIGMIGLATLWDHLSDSRDLNPVFPLFPLAPNQYDKDYELVFKRLERNIPWLKSMLYSLFYDLPRFNMGALQRYLKKVYEPTQWAHVTLAEVMSTNTVHMEDRPHNYVVDPVRAQLAVNVLTTETPYPRPEWAASYHMPDEAVVREHVVAARNAIAMAECDSPNFRYMMSMSLGKDVHSHHPSALLSMLRCDVPYGLARVIVPASANILMFPGVETV
jgi:hypothetical protein